MREALAHLRRLDRFAELQPAAAAAEGQRPLLLLFGRVLLLLVRVAHLDPIPTVVPHRPGRSGFRPSIDYRPRAKAGELFRIADQPAAQPAAAERYMYHMIAAKNRAHLGRGQHGRNRQVPPERTDLAAPALGAVQCRQQQGRLSGADGFAHLLETGNRETGPARQSDRLAAALRQQRLDAIRKPWRHG